jgi:site-specific recombinase XerD
LVSVSKRVLFETSSILANAGTQSFKSGTELPVVQAMLGHANLAATSIYMALAREDMDRELQEHAL